MKINMINSIKHRITSDSILSRICLASLIWIIIGGFSMNVWGAVTEQGSSLKQVTINGNSYHVVMESTEEKQHQYGNNGAVSRNNSAPAGALFIQMRQSSGSASIDQREIIQCSEDGDTYKDVATVNLKNKTSYEYYGPYTNNVTRATKYIRTKWDYGTKYRMYQNVYLTMASYCETVTTELDFSSNTHGTTANQTFTINWSNVADAEISITGTDASHYEIVEAKSAGNSYLGSAAGKYGYTTVTVRYKRDAVGTHNTATLSVHGVSVALKGTTTKRPNSISWSVDEDTKKYWGQTIEMSATATNTDYTNYPIVYTSSNSTYASVSGNVVTFLAAGAGQTVTITASQLTSDIYLAPTSVSKTFTIKQSQTIVWDDAVVNNPTIRKNKTRDLSSYVTAYHYGSDTPLDARAITITSANVDKITVSGKVLTASKDNTGDVDIIATVAGDDDYNEVSSRITFTVLDLEAVVYSLGGVIITDDNDDLALKVGESSDEITSTNTTSDITGSSNNPSVASYDVEANTIVANGAGSAVITLSQKATEDYQAGNRTVNVTVTLNTTTITTNVSAKTMEVGDEYNPELSTNNDEVDMSISSTNSAVAVYEDGVIKAKGAGSTTITFLQAKTTKWTADTVTIAVTVNKKDPTITITGVPATAWNETIEPTITSTNADRECAITIAKFSGADAAARVKGSKVVVYNKDGETVTFRVSQEGNDTCNAATKDFSFTVRKPATHVEYVKGDVTLAKDNTSDAIGFIGVPKSVTFTPTSSAWANRTYRLYWCATEDGEYTEFASFDKDKEKSLQEVSIDPHAKFIKVQFDGADNMNSDTEGTFKALTITEHAAEIVVNGLTDGYYDFGSTHEVGNPATDRAIGIKWYSVPKTTVTSSNPGVFDVITETIDSEIDDLDESTSITIRYHHKAVTVDDKDEATITLTSENGYTTSFKVKGKTVKKDQTLIWQEELTPLSVGDIIPNPAIAPLALDYSIVSTTEEGVVEVVDGVLKAKKVGTVTIRVANDGDAMWNPVAGEYTIKVTDLKVQRINWSQTFTRLKTTDADSTLNAVAYERIDGVATPVARSVSYSSDNTSVVSIVDGKLHVVGAGTANLTASVAGVDGEYEPASITRKVKVRVPSSGCTPYVLNGENGKMFTVDANEYSLSGEPAQITFNYWGENFIFPPSGPIRFAEYYDGSWHERLKESVSDTPKPATINLNRSSTKVKFYTEIGATCYHCYGDAYVTKAKYLELEDTKDKTSTSVAFDDANLGQTYIQSVVVNYSNIYDMLYVDHKNSNFRLTPTELGESCGENGRATITIIYYAQDVIDEKDTITITDNNGLTATIYVATSVSKSPQTISWDPETEIKTTDAVTFDATASSGLDVTYDLAEGDEDVATVTTAGVLTIKTAGDIHVIASQAGSSLYKPITLDTVTIHISKVTPEVSVVPTVSDVTLPQTLDDVTLDDSEAEMVDDKETAVAGSYAWVDGTTVVTAGTHDYAVRFTPTKTAWYNTTDFNVSITAEKRDQIINWAFEDDQTLPCSAIIPFNATITDDYSDEVLDRELTYEIDDEDVAEIVDGDIVVKKPGEITITVSNEGDATYNEASITRTVTFEKATPTIATEPTANDIYIDQWLHESTIIGGEVRSSGRTISGRFVWKTEDFQAETSGEEDYEVEFIPANEACYNRVTCSIPLTILRVDREFTNKAGDNDWNNPKNWSNGFVPTSSDVEVSIAQDVTISSKVSVYKFEIKSGATVTIAPTGGLTVGVEGLTGEGKNNIILQAGTTGVTKGQTGYLRIDPDWDGAMPNATVEMYSIAYADNSSRTATWQYIGIPVKDDTYGWDVCTYGKQFIYGWNEATGGWFDAYEEKIDPFKGYCVTQNNNATGRTFTFAGQLYAPSTKEIPLSYTGTGDSKGYHVLANSFAAPIDISRLDPKEDFVNASATIYLFNTGSYDKDGYTVVEDENSTTAGQYIAVTPGTAAKIYDEDETKSYPVMIPAMQGFCVKATAASASITLDYEKLVWEADYGEHLNQPMRVAAKNTNEPNVTDFIKVTLSDGEAGDNLYLLASGSYDKSYENGYDAPKMMSDDPALPNIFAVEDDGQLAIDATSDMEGTFLGVRTGAATQYTMYFSHVDCETEWMLLDIERNEKTLITDGASYKFSAPAGQTINDRFLIVEYDGSVGVTTGTDEIKTENKIQKFIYNDQMYILKDGVLYDARGMLIRR